MSFGNISLRIQKVKIRLNSIPGAQTGGKILLMSGHSENTHIIEKNRFQQIRQLPRGNIENMESSKITLNT